MSYLIRRWRAESGYRDVLRIALPLILSTGSWSLQQFIDRIFLTWYSPESIAASMPAGLMNWTLMSLFIGTAGYVNTFVAQFYGAGRFRRVGAAVWQGIWLSLLVIPVAALCYGLAEPLFSIVDHGPAVRAQEVVYFRILMIAAPFVVITHASSSFFSGLGRTWVVMWVNVLGTAVNLILDWLMIFGYGGFPEMGIAGAGWATTLASVVTAVVFVVLMSAPGLNREFATLDGWRFDAVLFRRLLRFGLPSGMQFVLEVFAFTLFVMLVGVIGMTELAATNIAFNINSLAFMPMFGMSLAVSTLVGQHLGENRPDLAEKATWSAFHLAMAFFVTLGLLYFLVPQWFLAPFAARATGSDWTAIHHLTVLILKLVALYCLFDAGNMVFVGTLKGAGDTRFVAIASVGLSWVGMLVPSLLSVYVWKLGVVWLWGWVTLYVVGLCFIFYWRFRQGRWRTMRVIEEEPPLPEEVAPATGPSA